MLLAVVKQMGGFLERGTMKWKVLANRKGRGDGFQQLKQQLSCVGAWGPVRVRSVERAVELWKPLLAVPGGHAPAIILLYRRH